eukprot:TRINITY_DN34104_c0_g1_i1.p1 TRINITY_DN34104_c0_g1~~TRINITY_DN34104_c0_g1_i1.p1  ORF type:complete len:294 (-),score=109.34 TRINITY_DN34104_c0_g1_i1:339-1220(-)
MVVKSKIEKAALGGSKTPRGEGGSRASGSGSAHAQPVPQTELEAALDGGKDESMEEQATQAAKRRRGKKEKESMTEEGYHNLVALIARLGLNLASQTRILRSVAQQTLTMRDTIKLHGSEFTFMQEIKQVSKNHFNKIKETEAADREKLSQELGPVHIHCWSKFVDLILKKMQESDMQQFILEEHTAAVKLLQDYKDAIAKYDKPELKHAAAVRRIKFFRLASCFKKGMMKLEISAGISASLETDLVGKTLFLLESLFGARERLGVAPRSNLERMVANQMVALNTFSENTRDD